MTEIVNVISTVGFPIACAIALAMYSYKTTIRIIDLTEKVTNALASNSDKLEELSDAINKLAMKGE